MGFMICLERNSWKKHCIAFFSMLSPDQLQIGFPLAKRHRLCLDIGFAEGKINAEAKRENLLQKSISLSFPFSKSFP